MSRFAVLGLVTISLCAGFSAAADDELSFIRKEMRFNAPLTSAGEALRIFDAQTDTLIVRTRDEDANHAFQLISNDDLASDSPQVTKTVAVPKNAIFYTLGEMPDGETEKLLIFTEKGISAYNPASNTFDILSEERSIFRQGTDLRFQRSGFAQDLNNDDRFDLLVQDFDGLKIMLQRADGSFTDPTLIPIEPELRLTGEFSNDNISDTAFSAPAARTPTFNIFPSYIADSNGDGKSDITFLVGRELKVFEQLSADQFSTTPITVQLPFDVRGNTWRDEVLSQEQNTDQSDFSETTVYRVTDMDGDETLDIITVNNQASGLLDRNQIFHTYFGRLENGELTYGTEPDQTFELDGVGGAGFRDVNDDGRKDVVITSTAISIGKLISLLINRKVTTRTRFHIDDGAGTFVENKDYRRSRTFKINLSNGQTSNPPFDYADFNGDDAVDLMEADSKGRMVFLAGGEGQDFTSRMGEITETFPNEGWLVTAEDINNDSKADIIVRYNQFGLDGDETPEKLVLYISQ